MEKDILFNIKELHHLIGKGMFKNVRKPTFKITATQIRFIDYLIEHEKDIVYQKDLENAFHITRATVCDVLKTMEKHKIITRVVSDEDTRTKKIILNEEFRKHHKRFKQEVKKMNNIVTKDITSSELKLFNEIINKMKNNIYEYLECDKERNDDND